jgi:hypothetical protein
MPGLPPCRQLAQRHLRGSDPAPRRVGQPVLMTDELQRSLTDRIEHLIAAEVQRDRIDLQLVGHAGRLSLDADAR